MMRSPRILIPVVGVVVLALAATAVVFAFSSTIFGSGYKAAAFMPRDTWLAAATTMRPGLRQSMAVAGVIDSFTKQPGWDETLQKLQEGSKQRVDLDLEILPLLDGEIAIALSGTAKLPDTLLFVHTSDPERLLRLMARSAEVPEPSERYRGALTYTTTDDDGRQLQLIASAKGWIVGGSGRRVAEQAYDRVEDGAADPLGTDPRFRSVMDRLPADHLGYVFWDGRILFTDPTFSQSFEVLPENVRDYFEPLNARTALTVHAASEGLELRWESIPERPAAAKAAAARGSALTAFDRLPSDTVVALGGDSLPGILADLETAANDALGELGSFAPSVEFDFSRWLGGEFAVGMGPGDLKLIAGRPQGSPDVLFAAKLKDAAAADTALDSFDFLLGPKERSVSGYLLKEIDTGDAAVVYGVGGDWLYAAAGRTAHLVPAAGGRSDGLTTARNFGLVRRAIAPDGFSMYVDVENGRRWMEDLIPAAERAEYEGKARVFLQPLLALGGSSRTDPNGDVHGMLLIAIKR